MANNGRPSGEDSPGGIQVIARAAAIMRALSEHSSGMSLGAIAKDIDLPRSTVQRIVNALKQEGLVESLSQNGGLRLGGGRKSDCSARCECCDKEVFGFH